MTNHKKPAPQPRAEPSPSLRKLFDDLASKQRIVWDEFEEFMSDVEDCSEADEDALKEQP